MSKYVVYRHLKSKGKSGKSNSGFTLIEIIISIALLGILVAAVLSSLLYTMQGMQYNRARVIATNLANATMEPIRAMTYSDIGIVGGNPVGTLPETEVKTIDGRNYTIKRFVSWVQGGANVDSDYKEVRVVVSASGFFNKGARSITKDISTFFSRNSEQSILQGANLRVTITRGWNTTSVDVPVEGITAILTNESTSVVTKAYSSTAGIALFLGMTAGSYTVGIDPSFMNMIIFPGTYPQINRTIIDNNTLELNASVEYPCRLNFVFLNADTSAPISFNLAQPGSVILHCPWGSDITDTFTQSASDGSLASSLFTSLWPVGAGYVGSYLYNVEVPGYLLSSINAWDGMFLGPNTTKTVNASMYKIPTVPAAALDSIVQGWTSGPNFVATSIANLNGFSFTENTPLDKVLCPAWFNTTDPSNGLVLISGNSPHYTASELYFSNNSLTVQKSSSLFLKANRIVINGQINLQNDTTNPGKVNLSVVKDAVTDGGTGIGSIDSSEATDQVVSGSDIGGIPGASYGVVYFGKDVILESSTLKVDKGVYYFPDGYQLPDDIGKLPASGGLIRK